MRKRMKIILIACGVGIPIIAFLCYVYFPWVILPTASSPHTLTLVDYGGPRIHQITMRHYVNDVPINDYVLELKIGVRYQHSQSYKLPKVDEGRVEINVELVNILDRNVGTLTINYTQTSNLYEKGLLIYNAEYSPITYIDGSPYFDQYVYFISGKEKTYYFKKAGSAEWSLITDAPQIKRFTRETNEYSPLYYGWKENEWVVLPANNTSDN